MTNSTHQQDEHQSSSKSSSRRITLAHQNPQCVPTVTPSKNNEMSQDEFEASVTRVQLRMGSQLKEMMKRRQIVEKEIEALQTEMEESLFFHELGDDEDNDAVHMDAEPFDEKRNDLTCTLASFEYTAAALSKAQETNKTLANEIKVRLLLPSCKVLKKSLSITQFFSSSLICFLISFSTVHQKNFFSLLPAIREEKNYCTT